MSTQCNGAVKLIGLAAGLALLSSVAYAGGGGGGNPCSISPSSNSGICKDISGDIKDLILDLQSLSTANSLKLELAILKDIVSDTKDLQMDISQALKELDGP